VRSVFRRASGLSSGSFYRCQGPALAGPDEGEHPANGSRDANKMGAAHQAEKCIRINLLLFSGLCKNKLFSIITWSLYGATD
jgi:hypothetical protein